MLLINLLLGITLNGVMITAATSSCESKLTCQECILDAQLCKWCAKENMGINCKPANVDDGWCDEADLQNPKGSNKLVEDKEFTSDSGKVIQIKPQSIDMKLRVGETYDFGFSFLAAKNYPVDLYFLIDASESMSVTKEAVKTKGTEIYKKMVNLTNNAYIGLGTFIDKNYMPFVIDKTATTYSFRNELQLTDDANKFVESVKKYNSGSNFDAPEGGFDALSQVIVCKEEIGWRNESRKIIVFMTDGPYHAAGDGKWAGIFKPHDGNCHIKDNRYTKELEFDYPSLGLINKLASEHEIIIMFISTDINVADCYASLQKNIKGSYHIELGQSSEIVQKLEDIYKKISKVITIKTIITDNKISKNVNISLTPDCRSGKNAKDPKCIQDKGMIEFQATIRVNLYDGVDNFKINLVPEGIKEQLTLNVEILKSCDCENLSEDNSTKCHGGGSFQCGKCKCNEHRHGENCKCTTSESGITDDSPCIDNTTQLVCNGHGVCKCGSCICYQNYEGPYCNCDQRSCHINLEDNSLCSRHGKCDCGTCTCNIGWEGDACDCTKADDNCIDPGSLSVCADNGECKCGLCECTQPPVWDIRKQNSLCAMDDCAGTNCDTRQCNLLTDCALCYQRKNQNCSKKCPNVKVEYVDKIHSNTSNSDINENWVECKDVKTAIGCYTIFLYRYNGKYLELLLQTESDCAESYFMYGGTFMAMVLLIGLLTLIIWKVLTRVRDRQEYERFKRQYASALWPETTNPIYEPASTTFDNPTFGRSVS